MKLLVVEVDIREENLIAEITRALLSGILHDAIAELPDKERKARLSSFSKAVKSFVSSKTHQAPSKRQDSRNQRSGAGR